MRLGIDLGGTKIEGVALDETGEICCRKRLPTPTVDSTVMSPPERIDEDTPTRAWVSSSRRRWPTGG